MAACCAAPRTERRSRVGCRSGGVQAHVGVRESGPGGAARGPCPVASQWDWGGSVTARRA
eukprot:1807823-Prymnesium_polylepis.1